MEQLKEHMITIAVTGIIIIACLIYLWDRFATGKMKGNLGEYLLDKQLKRLSKKNDNDGHIYKDIYIHKEDGNTTQIDNIFLSKYGLFVFETKHYKGKIFGEPDKFNWTQRTTKTFKNKRGKEYTKVYKNKLYNPIMQNSNHIKHLSHAIEYDQNKIANFVCFTGSANINEIWYIKNVHTLKSFRKLYKDLKNTNNIRIGEEELAILKDKIDYFIVQDKKISKKHNKYVKEVTQSIDNKYNKWKKKK